MGQGGGGGGWAWGGVEAGRGWVKTRPQAELAAEIGSAGCAMADPPTRERARAFWVFDRPLHRDWLFLAGLAAGLAFAVFAVAGPGRPSALVLAYELFWALPGGVMAAGVVGGTIRELFRMLRRGAR